MEESPLVLCACRWSPRVCLSVCVRAILLSLTSLLKEPSLCLAAAGVDDVCFACCLLLRAVERARAAARECRRRRSQRSSR